MSALDKELERLMQLDLAVRTYLSFLWDVEQGGDDDGNIDRWLDRLQELTND